MATRPNLFQSAEAELGRQATELAVDVRAITNKTGGKLIRKEVSLPSP
jgi:hypothetical protein